MNARKTYLIGTILFTFLFMALVLLASLLLTTQNKQLAVVSFLFAFIAILGQIICLALYARQRIPNKTLEHTE